MRNISSEILELALKYSYDEISVIDEHGIIVFDNSDYNTMYGTDIIGMHISEIKNKVCDFSLAERIFKEKRTIHTLQKILHRNSNRIVSGVPIFEGEKIKYIVTISRDTSLFSENVILNKISNKNSLQENENLKSVLKKYNYKKSSSVMQSILQKAAHFAKRDTTIFITGESGTGKSLLAKIIHDLSSRNDSNFIAINCAAIPTDLLESELFGYAPGAFTGASKLGKAGIFELASNGTLFLDEISELPLHLQGKLLSALQEKKIRRVGGLEDIPVNIRFICATNVDIEECVRTKKFREDLYYRINVLRINMPALRERKEDIVELIKIHIENKSRIMNRNFSMTQESLNLLQEYKWPGNIRELENVIEYITAISDHDIISTDDLPQNIKNFSITKEATGSISAYEQQLDNFKRDIIQNSFRKNKSSYKVARELGISQTKASRLIRKYCTGNN